MLWALGVFKVLWRALWPTVWFSLGSKKGGSIEPPFVGGLVLVGGGRRRRWLATSFIGEPWYVVGFGAGTAVHRYVRCDESAVGRSRKRVLRPVSSLG